MIAAEHCRDLVVGEAAADEGLGQTRQMVDAFQTAGIELVDPVPAMNRRVISCEIGKTYLRFGFEKIRAETDVVDAYEIGDIRDVVDDVVDVGPHARFLATERSVAGD